MVIINLKTTVYKKNLITNLDYKFSYNIYIFI